MDHATGTFEVATVPLTADNSEAELAGIGRMSINKLFQGDIEAASTGEMMYLGTEHEGSRIYVALERVKGALGGKNGSFVLYHVGTMKRGEPRLSIKILEDSGTGDLSGITGEMVLIIEDGKHYYDLEYWLDDAG